ncbi:uncharacterized protein K460DRAFT_90967 [Cucurbitaria berberidis CBS 394.84]|uniref:Uncharacterized protein n=1 Tax=Cucurbitaria berberidis CBS 394.84 TaxID=1168544 RepID=A0A9P4GN07_9PLEO|nr:uncharacterized protein K460DRAFT_90967 [Cucurbitaria berberidis CBS 394.84]KAF1849438.1 hypothetical protein K460DRAFT_90967 [Cucurbitaria berberidis CBS 394.84]
MMLSLLKSPKNPPKGQSLGHQTYYGHPTREATKCGHDIHPSASTHTPWCPGCIASLTKAKLDAAQNKLITEGGLSPAEHMRDRRWNQARLKHEIAKQRLEKARKEGQLRWEREQAWDEAHQPSDSQRAETATGLKSSTECPVCASMVASYPTKVPEMEVAKDVPWWEQPCGHAVEDIVVPITLPRLHHNHQPWQHTRRPESSQALRKIIQNLRVSMHSADNYRRTWDNRYKTESAVRRKHSLGQDIHFEPDFWDSPICGLTSRRDFQHVLENQRMAARRARGNIPRPKLPRSSLSHTELSEQLHVDEDWIEAMREKEELEELEREARKVGEEVGYLYFVGTIDGMEEWKEDYLQSDRQLVVRTLQ